MLLTSIYGEVSKFIINIFSVNIYNYPCIQDKQGDQEIRDSSTYTQYRYRY